MGAIRGCLGCGEAVSQRAHLDGLCTKVGIGQLLYARAACALPHSQGKWPTSHHAYGSCVR